MNEAEMELQMAGYQKKYDYSQYAHDNNVNVIPEQSFKQLITDTFKTISDVLKSTYGPYGSSIVISEQSDTITTKDGYNVFEAIGFNHTYKRMVYLAISKIIKRVNKNVGDGTTSCILIADKIFNNLKEIINTPDNKRRVLHIIDDIERYLQNSITIKNDLESGDIIKPLTDKTLMNLIKVASNYDKELSEIVYEALDPLYEQNGRDIVSLRNVIADSEIIDSDSERKYEIDYLPGDYRVGVKVLVEDSVQMINPHEVRVVIYDHSFNDNDWDKFITNWNGHETLIVARTFAREFLEGTWINRLRKINFDKKMGDKDATNGIRLVWITGPCIQDQLADLAAVLGTEARGLHADVIDHSTLPTVTAEIYKGDCLALHDVKGKATMGEYIEKLEHQLENEKSYVKATELQTRIDSLKMDSSDTLVIVKCSSSLEAKLIKDKIDDCISIAKSAHKYGVVPNLFKYVYNRMKEYEDGVSSDLEASVSQSIRNAITGSFADIWESKYGKVDVNLPSFKKRVNLLYNDSSYNKMSFDIINEDHVDMCDIPTSPQYDLEVVAASLSIVKYLLTGRALIFDAHILPAVVDDGHYEQ